MLSPRFPPTLIKLGLAKTSIKPTFLEGLDLISISVRRSVEVTAFHGRPLATWATFHHHVVSIVRAVERTIQEYTAGLIADRFDLPTLAV